MDLKALSKKPIVRIGLTIIGSFLCVCCFLTWITINPDSALLATETPRPTKTPGVPTSTPIPTSTLPPIEDLRSRIETTLGESNRNVTRVSEYTWDEPTQILFVTFSINDNLTEGFIVTGIQSDITDILKTVTQSRLVPGLQSITVSGTFVLADQFGNKSEDLVIRATYSRATLDKINWDNFLYTNILNIADDLYVQQDLQRMIRENP